jgi:transcriptional regulator with XRE-family HTH domain
MSIDLNIRKLIEEKKVRKVELAKYLDVARNTLDDYLSGRTYMTTDKLSKLSKFFDVPVGYFFDDETSPSISQKVETGSAAASIYGNAAIGNITEKDSEIDCLKEIIKGKDREIDYLKEIIKGKDEIINTLKTKIITK